MSRQKGSAPAKAPSEFDAVLADIVKHKGESCVLPARQIPVANSIPTGSFILDFALLGGLPDGYVSMVYGLESSGKTTILKKSVGNYQRKYPKRKVLWVDPEGMFDKDWAAQLGCNLDMIHVARPQMGPEAVDIIEAASGASDLGLVVLDSIPACVPKRVLDKSAEDKTQGELAALMGVMCSKIAMRMAIERRRGHFVTTWLVNSWRFKIGVMFGDPRTLPGGRQINHLPTTKIELKNEEVSGKKEGDGESNAEGRIGRDKFGHEVVEFNRHTFKISKAKHGSSIRNGEFCMMINPDNAKGIPQGSYDDAGTVIVYAKRMGLVSGGGASWKIEGESQKFRTLADMETFLREKPEANLSLQQAIIAAQRVSKGLTALPPDKYLLDWCEVE